MGKTNREKLVEACKAYIDTLDDEGLYDFISDQGLDGENIFSCRMCEKVYGDERCGEMDICWIRFKQWIGGKNENSDT